MNYSWFTMLCKFQKSDSVIQIHIFILFQVHFPFIIEYWAGFPMLYLRSFLVIYVKYSIVYIATTNSQLTHWKRPWCWERLKVGGKGDNRGRAGWMASSTWLTWDWANSKNWWCTGRPGVPQSMGLQRVRRDWVTELRLPVYPSSHTCPLW